MQIPPELFLPLGLWCASVIVLVVTPSLFYSNAMRTVIYLLICFVCFKVFLITKNFLLTVACMAALLSFMYLIYCSRWFMLSVFKVTYKEWQDYKQIDDAELDANKEELFRLVAESWNPRWKDEEVLRLATGCESLDELIDRIKKGKWRAENEV